MRLATVFAAALLVSVALVGSATGQDADQSAPGIAETIDRIDAVAETVEQSRQTAETVGTGAVLGLGLGLVAGSVSMFAYWNRKLS